MVQSIRFVGVRTDALEAMTSLYRDLLGADVGAPRDLPEHGVSVVFVALDNTKLELMTPLGDTSPVARFLLEHPAGGMHHICFEVPDLAHAARTLVAGGARLLGDGQPRIGAHGLPVLFLHPKDFDGTLIELEEVKPEILPA
jgi:methylmalonyl-CoA/ethylmalonyl-CoA epimerase